MLSAMLIFLLLHFYTWTRKFAFIPGDPFWVQIWPVNCFELLCGPYGIKISPDLGLLAGEAILV